MSSKNANLENILEKVATQYPVLTSKPLQVLCQQSKAVAQQFEPSIHELETVEKEFTDPIGDASHTPIKGIVHRYPNRVLLTPSVNCPSYCRFCFRKARVGQEKDLTNTELNSAINYIKSNAQINEVILSGGEPLALSVKSLNAIFRTLEKINHIKVIRIHTRIQLTGGEQALTRLGNINWPSTQLYIVLHCNHPDEIDDRFRTFVELFKQSTAVVLSQTVLLKEINDSTTTLNQLFTTLTQCGVTPYYLHHPDLVKGAGHFRVSLKRGMKILQELQGEMPGYAIPRYILDLPGGLGKVPINKSWLNEVSDETYEITSPFGKKTTYLDCGS